MAYLLLFTPNGLPLTPTLQADPPRDTYIDPDTGYSVFTQVSEYLL